MLHLCPGLAGPLRPRGFLLALALLSLLQGAPARAEDQSGDGDDGSTATDTLTARQDDGTVFGYLGIRPLYTSTVELNRTVFKWDQALTLDRAVERLKLENKWNLGIQKNSAQNNYKLRDGRTKARGEYTLPNLGGWSTGADLQLKRVFSGSDIYRTVDNGSEFDWFLTAGAPGTTISRLLRLAEGAFSWDITGKAGATQNTDVRENRPQGGGLTGFRSDSTDASGTTSEIDSRIAAAAGTKFKLDVSGSTDRANEDSSTRQRKYVSETSLTDSTLADKNRSSGRRVSFNSSWTPNAQNRVGFTGQFSKNINQSYSADVQAQDTKTGLTQRVALDAKLVPFWGVNLDLKAENNLTDIAYKVGRQGRGGTRKKGEATVNFIFGKSVPLLHGTETTTEVRYEKSRNTFQLIEGRPDQDYDNETTYLRQALRRPLGTRVAAVATGEANLSRMLYDARSQDKDDLKYLLDGALSYRPNAIFDCKLIGQWRRQQTVYIPAANSRNTVTAQSYQVGAEMAVEATPTVKVTQKYTMTADYSFYDFNDKNNALSRTTEVRTVLLSTLGTKAKLGIDHQFRFKDSGKYLRENPQSPRLYSKAAKEIYQFLTVTTRYDFSPEFALRASQRMEVRSTKLTGVEKVNRTKKIEFTGGMDLNHHFSTNFSIRALAERTQSTAEKSYWRVSASVDRSF